MRTALWPLQTAIFKRLSNDAALNDRINGVFDDVPEYETDEFGNRKLDESGDPIPVEKPYCVIGEPTVSSFETKSSYGENMTIVLHCWSDYPGKKEAYDILNLMLKALSRAPLSIEGGFSLFRFNVEQMQVITDIDGTTKHGILRVRYYINN